MRISFASIRKNMFMVMFCTKFGNLTGFSHFQEGFTDFSKITHGFCASHLKHNYKTSQKLPLGYYPTVSVPKVPHV